MDNRTVIAVATITIAAVLFLWGNSNSLERGGNNATPAEVKIGVLLPLSGGPSVAGLKIQHGYQYAADEINDAGGISHGGSSVPLKLIFADSEAKPDVGVNEIERLIGSEDVLAIAGCYQSSVALPTTAIAERNRTPYVVGNPVADKITERDFKYVFRIAVKASWMARSQIDFLTEMSEADDVEIRTLGLLYEDTLFGQSSAAGQRQFATAAGLEVVADLPYASNGTDYSATIAKLRDVDPDVVIAVSYTPDAIQLARTMAELDYFPRVAFLGSTAGHQDPDFISSLGPLAEGILTTTYWNDDLSKPGVKEYFDAYVEKFGQRPAPQCINARSALWVIKDALERADGFGKEELRASLAETNMSGTEPPLDITPYDAIRFGADGQNTEAKAVIMQVKNGAFVTVWPKSVSVESPQLPVLAPRAAAPVK